MTATVPPPRAENSIAEVWFLDVGQGDCTLILDSESGRALLIDCPTQNVDLVVRVVRENNISIDTAIVTHWDLDHYGGVARIAEAFHIRKVLYNNATIFPTPQSFRGIRSTLKQFLGLRRFGTELGAATEGTSDEIGHIQWRLLAPTHDEITEAMVANNRNVASAVAFAKIGPISVLIGGDAVADTWRRLLGTGLLGSDILRWPHHGANLHRDMTGEIRDRVLAQVDPKFVVISTGATNNYGHPSRDVVKAASAKATVMCTQVTPACFGHRSREEQNSRVGRNAVRELASPVCAGTVRVSVTEEGMSVYPDVSLLGQRIQQWPRPMCLTD